MATRSSTDAAGANSALEPRITVIGVGGAGGNAINNMIRAELKGVEFVVANTDTQALQQSLCATRIQLGARATQGLGAGARPEIGRAAAEETLQAMVAAMRGSNMVFITAGMGGGTGTGAAPVIAREAREAGILTVGVVTKPFAFEGARRMRQAEAGIAELARYVDTLIVIRNQNLFLVAEATTTFADAFKMADEVLRFGVRGVTDLMVMPGLVNLDFADVRAIMAGMGKAVMGTGEAVGDNRALAAAEAAIANPLLDGISMKGARSVLVNITGGPDLTLVEVDIAASRIREEVDADARIIFGSALSDTLGGKIRVSVIATGSDVEDTDHAAPGSDGRFVGARTPNRSTTPAAQVLAWDDEEQDRADDEPITLRLVSKLPAPDLESGPATTEWQLSDPTPDLPAAAGAQPTAPPQAAGLPADAAGTPSDGASDGEPLIGDELPSFLTRPSEPAPARAPGRDATARSDADSPRPTRAIPMRNIIGALKPKLQRPARPVKSVSTLEAFELVRAQEATAKTAANKQLYVVWKAERGARIFTVAAEKVPAIQAQPYADRLKLFDNLENAKAEVNAIFKRAAAERTAQGLAGADTDPILADIMGWEENNIPRYPF